MYVIWRRRKREHYAGFWNNIKIGDVCLTPIIVQSRRVDGKPKQEHIACLPSIIESQINDKNAVWFWTAVEEQLARLTNRISRDDMQKIRAALDKAVSQPDPEFAENLKDGAAAHTESMLAVLTPRSEWERNANMQMHAFSSSFKTAQACADCGGELTEVYRERRTFGHGLMRGRRWTVGVLCKKCAHPPRDSRRYHFSHYGPCETCEREVFISRSIRALRVFCSTRCGQTYYRKVRRGRGQGTVRNPL